MPKTKILIVEDESLIALQLRLMLDRAGYEVCEPVGRGEDAIDLARAEKPDVILMDISLGGDMDGIETALRIADFSSALVIFTTGHSDPGMRDRAQALNPAAYLIKPIEIRSIQSAIKDSSSQ